MIEQSDSPVWPPRASALAELLLETGPRDTATLIGLHERLGISAEQMRHTIAFAEGLTIASFAGKWRAIRSDEVRGKMCGGMR